MHIEDDNGVLLEDGSNDKNKVPQQASHQAGTSNFINFDYEIPQAPSIEAMFNTIIINQKAHNMTMNMMASQVVFLTRNLAYFRVPFLLDFLVIVMMETCSSLVLLLL